MDKDKSLIQAAIEGLKNAYTGTNKPEDVRFAAVVLTKNGNIYASGQYYSDTYSLTLHAEQAALAHAAAHGEYEIEKIAVIANETAVKFNNNQTVYPCHMCKQLLWESHLRSKINTEIIILNPQGNILERFNLLDIINHPWPKV
ncbi:cytidine deaminase [Patescibacteria group bacterium]|nr:cytidine deaminase [Patescibacteria group bacterium]